jgi:hypothetical protein
LVVVGLLFVTGLVFFLIWTNSKAVNESKQPAENINSATNITPIPRVKQGQLTMSLSGGNKPQSIASSLVVVFSGDLAQENVVSYDLLFQFDSDNFTVGKVSSALNDFDVYQFVKEKVLVVTAVKRPDSTVSHQLNNNRLLTVTLKPKKKGEFTLKCCQNLAKDNQIRR